MKFLTLLAAMVLAATLAPAQWETVTYSLKGGWNAIHLAGDARHGTLDTLLPPAVVEVWRWNPNPTQVQFTQSPLLPSAGTPEWSVWKRGQPEDSTLSQLTGQASYLVKCTGTTASTYQVALRQSPLPPDNRWVRNGANLMGFPAAGSGSGQPLMSAYFASFPIATAPSTRIFKYAGGDLGAANPVQVFSPSVERLDRTKAYWFSAETVGNFYAPVDISLSTTGGLSFGRAGSLVTAQVRNKTSATMTLTFTPTTSENAPAGQTPVTGPVPLTLRTYNATTLLWEEKPLGASCQAVVAPQSTVEIRFGIDRASAAMAGAPAEAFFASILRVTDAGNLFDIHLPVSATKDTLAGLWVGDVIVSGVDGAPVQRAFPLRTLLHVADDGTARLLSQAFIGKLAASPSQIGVCTDESLLDPASLATAQRLVAAHLPLQRTIAAESGGIAIGQSQEWKITIPFDDPTNPFIHQYHPDHDNKGPRGQPLAAGGESYDVHRSCTFHFTASPPAGSTVTSGWGSSVIGGTYREVLGGLKSTPVILTGTFELRRASEDGTLRQ